VERYPSDQWRLRVQSYRSLRQQQKTVYARRRVATRRIFIKGTKVSGLLCHFGDNRCSLVRSCRLLVHTPLFLLDHRSLCRIQRVNTALLLARHTLWCAMHGWSLPHWLCDKKPFSLLWLRSFSWRHTRTAESTKLQGLHKRLAFILCGING
jgi:hypothetical protein